MEIMDIYIQLIGSKSYAAKKENLETDSIEFIVRDLKIDSKHFHFIGLNSYFRKRKDRVILEEGEDPKLRSSPLFRDLRCG
jgi:hypothetical protein